MTRGNRTWCFVCRWDRFSRLATLTLARTWTQTTGCSSGVFKIPSDMFVWLLCCGCARPRPGRHHGVHFSPFSVLLFGALLRSACLTMARKRFIFLAPSTSKTNLRVSSAVVQVFAAFAEVAQQRCSTRGMHGALLLQLADGEHHEPSSQGNGAHPAESQRDPVRGAGRHQVSQVIRSMTLSI